MEKPKERLTGLDADGYIISTEEATIIAARPVSEEEKKSIRMHILEKLYEYENLDEEFCNWKIDIKSPELFPQQNIVRVVEEKFELLILKIRRKQKWDITTENQEITDGTS